ERLSGRQLKIRIGFVVAEQNVVFRRALLDEVIFESQRLDDRVSVTHLEPCRFVEERINSWTRSVGAKIAPHPIAEDPRFADVQSLPLPVGIQVKAGVVPPPTYPSP